MMFDSVMPDFDLTTITGKQEFRKWFTGAVRNEIRSYTPEALGVSTTIGNDINSVGVVQSAIKVSRGSSGAVFSPIVFEEKDWGTSNTVMWQASEPDKVILPYVGYYQVSGYIIGDSSSLGYKDINISLVGSGNIGYIAADVKNNIAPNENFMSSLSGLCYTNSINSFVKLYVFNSDGTSISNIILASMSAIYLGT